MSDAQSQTDPKDANKSTEHKESFVRWQATTLVQLGYTLNLLLGFATASLGFAFAQLKDASFALGCSGKLVFLLSLGSLILSVVLGTWCSINRLRDFRKTTMIARDRGQWCQEGIPDVEINRRLKDRRCETKMLGKITWRLFKWQIGTFAVGFVMLAATFVLVYRAKLF